MSEPTQQPRSQLSLKGLLSGVAIASGFLAIGAYLGFDNGFLIICSIASAVLTGVFVSTAPFGIYKPTYTATFTGLFLLCNPMLMFISAVVLVNCIGHWVLIWIYRRNEAPPTYLNALRNSLLATLFAFAIGIIPGLPGYLEFREALRKLEPVDIAEKLSYERELTGESPQKQDFKGDLTKADLSEYYFSTMEAESQRFLGRTWALEGIHQRRAEQFVKSPGFGIARMFPPTIERARLPIAVNIPFGEQIDDEGWLFRRTDVGAYDSANAEQMHLLSMFDFAHPDSFGLKVASKSYKGFASHAFHLSPLPMDDPSIDETLQLENLQLISLRRFGSARVYDLDHLPRMDQLSGEDVKTREPTSFEIESLEKLESRTPTLRKGEDASDIVIRQDAEKVEMVGAIRAMNSCLECHNAERHELLGAFTYRFSISQSNATQDIEKEN